MAGGAERDPRLANESVGESDARPVVDRPRAGLSGGAIAALAVLAGLLLFGVLEARRQNASAPAVTARSSDMAGSTALPPLYVPPSLPEQPAASSLPSPIVPVPSPSLPASADRERPSPPQAAGYAQLAPAYPLADTTPPAPPRTATGSALVLDNGAAPPAIAAANNRDAGPAARDAQSSVPTGRARAGMLANRASTVPQGTLIPAVLETAFDSTNAGFARALVQRDVRGFDGSRVLIRPDGATIALLSPAVDTLGRGGVKANVNTHFFERFSGAILQSVLDLGVTLAARSSKSPVVVALPGSIGGLGRTTTQPATIKPTLKVPAGRSVSIFVARDLDFTGMDRAS